MTFGDNYKGAMSGSGNLVLTRGQGQAVAIDHKGERLVVWISSIQNGRVRIGFHAPRSFVISREELMISGALLS